MIQNVENEEEENLIKLLLLGENPTTKPTWVK